jgi:ABC-2 type transport system ATP-binding protein
MQYAIETFSLTKIFSGWWRKNKVVAVDGLDLKVRTNEVFGLLGPNGSGKTTTLKMLLGLLHPTKGRALMLEGDARNPKVSARIGFLPEESYLYRYLTARETLNFYGQLFKLPAKVRDLRIEALLDMVGLKAVANRPVGTFSKGMARRIGLAQALINDPDLLILDEPSSGLDPVGVREFRDVVSRIKEQKKTIFLNSHQLSEVEKLADRLGIIEKGRLIRIGRIEELLTGEGGVEVRITPPADEAVTRKLESMSTRVWYEKDKGALVILVPDEGAVPEIMAAAREGGSKLISITPKRETLEQFFIESVRDDDKTGRGEI